MNKQPLGSSTGSPAYLRPLLWPKEILLGLSPGPLLQGAFYDLLCPPQKQTPF